jgi:hypothetical protein
VVWTLSDVLDAILTPDGLFRGQGSKGKRIPTAPAPAPSPSPAPAPATALPPSTGIVPVRQE